jgi:trans-2,3-dihydro-3-hydroxyanthranilate isomerase
VVRAEAAARLRLRRLISTHPYTLLDVFTDRACTGNGLAVVQDADDLDEAAMQAFARETRLSETTFVQAARADAADYRNRIWTIASELKFAGHPSLGTAVAVARTRGESTARYVQETPAGLQPIEVSIEGQAAYASMHQEPAQIGPEVDPERVMAAMGLARADAEPALPPQVVSTGVPQLVALVADREALSRVRVDEDALRRLLEPLGAVVLYATAWDPASGRAHARGLTPVVHGGEDPATGSAAGPLCAYLHARAGAQRVEIEQGIEMGRPSTLVAEMDGDRVRVEGAAVVLVEGTLSL